MPGRCTLLGHSWPITGSTLDEVFTCRRCGLNRNPHPAPSCPYCGAPDGVNCDDIIVHCDTHGPEVQVVLFCGGCGSDYCELCESHAGHARPVDNPDGLSDSRSTPHRR
jgi:hypothetical protein